MSSSHGKLFYGPERDAHCKFSSRPSKFLIDGFNGRRHE